jgi:membrane-bound lytic murein transglycosylase MltF
MPLVGRVPDARSSEDLMAVRRWLVHATGMRQATRSILLLLGIAAFGCSKPAAVQEVKRTSPPARAAQGAALPPPAYEAALPNDLRAIVDKTFTGDFDQMVQHRLIRAGVPFNRTYYFIDKGVQRGLSYEYLTLFEEELNREMPPGHLKVHVVLLPMSRDQLIPQLLAGKIDLIVAQMTVTPERQELVDFSDPTRSDVNEVLVTGPGAPDVKTFLDLRGRTVFVRKSSSYWASLEALNRRLKSQGRPTIRVEAAPENLEDDDLLEMVNAGLAPATVVDNYLAEYWKQVFPDLAVHEDLTLRTGGKLAVAIRKDSPRLAAELNPFIAKYGLSSVYGRVVSKRYLQSTQYVKSAASEADRQKFQAMVELFRKYGQEYSFDYLLMAAQAYQESRLDQNAKSHVGAVGVMQLMPATGKEQGVGDIRQLEPNIHAGVKYMRFMRNQYFEGQPMDDLNKGLFTFASYNAGAGRIASLRREAAARGLNPNVWFGNVERIASERIGRETVTYVSNIYKYYLAYRLISEEKQRRTAARQLLAKATPP